MHQVAGRVAGEDRSLMLLAQPSSLECQHARSSSETPSVQVRGRPVPANRVHLATRRQRPAFFTRHIHQQLARRKQRVTLHHRRFHHHMPQVMPIVAHEAVTPCIQSVAKLSRPGAGLYCRAVWPETKIHASQTDLVLGSFPRLPHLPAPQPAGDLHPPIVR